MAALLFIVLLQLTWTLGSLGDSKRNGAASFAYSDSSGRHYTATSNLGDGQQPQVSGYFPVPFSESAFPGYDNGYDYGQQANFYPTYFLNLENLLQEAFQSNLENQQLAFNAARKAFDISSNQAGYYPNFATRLPQTPYNNFGPFGGRYGSGYPVFPNFNSFAMSDYPNSAFASSAIGPGYRTQIAAINPANPNSPNVYIQKAARRSDVPMDRGFVSVSSNSYSTSSNINGQEVSRKGSTTIVDDNGKVTKYSVNS